MRVWWGVCKVGEGHNLCPMPLPLIKHKHKMLPPPQLYPLRGGKFKLAFMGSKVYS